MFSAEDLHRRSQAIARIMEACRQRGLLEKLEPLQASPGGSISLEEAVFAESPQIAIPVEVQLPLLEVISEHIGDATLSVRAAHGPGLSAQAFIIHAATLGLFNDEPPERYPRDLPECTSSVHRFRRRDYRVRQAGEQDLPRLWELEKLCWQHTRASRQKLRARVRNYPQGQYVLEKDGEVLGAIYSQRIGSIELLDRATAADVHQYHELSGPIIQLLAVNIDPRVQDRGYGDQLLELMLQRCALVAGVERVVGVTLCKSYDARHGESFEHYIHREGPTQDPVLAFHRSHGASVIKALPGYRPEDRANEGNGVLVSYDILHRVARPAAEGATSARAGQHEIRQFFEDRVIELAGVDRQAFNANQPLMELGLDSADLLKLQRQLETQLGRKLPPGFFFEHNSTTKVITFLTGVEPPPAENDRPGDVRKRRANSGTSSQDIAIVGLSCRLPGGIETPEQLWQVLASGRSVIDSYPTSRGRWASSAQMPAIDRGGYIKDVEGFDAEFFRISPAEAGITDPQQRILLELAWACLEDAGIPPATMQGSSTAVFVGASNCDYSRLLQDAGLEVEAHHGVASSLAILANRISYFFDLSGPSLLIDTACSSSLVALHTAIQSMRAGECAAALVAGVNVICHPDLSIAYHKAGMLAPDGQCKVFDARANGYVRSEGAVMMLLKPLAAAEAAQDRIYAVIKGSAINHGGLAGGLTVPNPKKQSDLLLAAWDNAGIAQQDLTYIEAHGTGTSLGDPIEMQGIQAAGQGIAACLVGSLKSNLGHLEPAAGLAGVLKLVLSLQHQQIPASIHFSHLNPKIRLDGTPFRIAQALSDWKSTRLRLAAVSSFGSGGTNAHVVVEEYPDPRPNSNEQGPFLFVLSATNEDRLRDYARRVLEWLDGGELRNAFADAIHTWQIGRAQLRQRLAIKVESVLDLRDRLQQWLSGRGELGNTWSSASAASSNSAGVGPLWADLPGQQMVAQALRARNLEQLAILWISGAQIDWHELYTARATSQLPPRRVSVPGYPFSRERHWVDSAARYRPAARDSSVTLLHPLVHVNTSDLHQQSYRSTFNGEEFFLADHRVALGSPTPQSVLPAVAFLEMARAAIETALPDRPQNTLLELQDIVWVQPLIVRSATEVQIALWQSATEQIAFEIYSSGQSGEMIHCQGHAVFTDTVASVPIDIAALKRQTQLDPLDADRAYTALSRMGLAYGPAHRSIVEIHRTNDQVLARLSLPAMLESHHDEYVLHPSLMDGALQASIGLIEGWTAVSKLPRLPFALDSLRILASGPQELLAWVRYSPRSRPEDPVTRLDIDLCDESGNLCVQMRGFSARAPDSQKEPAATTLATPRWEPESSSSSASAVGLADHHVLLCELPEVDGQLLESTIPGSRCSHLQSSPGATLAERYSTYALACFESVRRLLESKSRGKGKALVQLVLPQRADAVVFGGLIGLLKTAALENPDVLGQVILIEPGTTAVALAAQLREAAARQHETLIKYESNVRFVLRWQRVAAHEAITRVGFKEDGTYLITGGLGGLGLLFAREILHQASRVRVILTGREPLNTEKRALLAALAPQPGQLVEYCALDLVDAGQVRQLIAEVSEKRPLNGILHCAGTVADSFILKKSAAHLSQVLAPKVTGTYNLDLATADTELDFLVLFSSVVSITGNLGQADYAAANGFMDQFAAYRNEQVASGRRHGHTVSINWPFWIEGGMRLDPASQTQFRETTGMRPMPTANGLRAFHQCLALTAAQCWVIQGEQIAPQQGTLPTVSQPQTIQVSAGSLLEQTQDYLRRELSTLLKLPAHRIDPRSALDAYGIDSILAVNLVRQLEKRFGPLSKTLLFEYRTISELAQFFIEAHPARLAALFNSPASTPERTLPESAGNPEPARGSHRRRAPLALSAQRVQSSTEPIAIIGLSGRYPQAENVETYWHNLRDGKDCIVEVPPERWDWREFFSEDRTAGGRHYSKWGGFISGVDEFDPLFFNIAPREAKFIDPQERLFLQHAWMAVEDAGYTRASLDQVGVYVGVMWSEYQLHSLHSRPQDLRMGFAGNLASIANRVSYVLNLHGPSMTLDTMCSSSLTAIHVACQDLRQGRTQLAIAGGVNVSVHPSKYLMLSVGQFISSDGHCQSFGEGGDGYIPGEGVGVIVLKRLSDAERDGDHIYGTIRGSALNHGGRTNGYTVPNPQAQASVVSQALAESQIDVRQITYIEAHGTGTRLGDPIEIAGLTKAFRQHTSESGFCLIGSAKSNIGHCESAAGIAGLTKVLLQMQHRQIVPSLHSAQLNPHIEFSETPFVVNQRLHPWNQPVIEGRPLPRMAGISSFGAGGSNAHLIVEEPPLRPAPVTSDANVVIVLSARTEEQLLQKARDLLTFLRLRASEGIDLASLAYTLQVGREPMDERLGFIVSSGEKLAENLQAYLAGEQNIESAYQGQVKRNKDILSALMADSDWQETVEKWITQRKLGRLLELWVKGLELDWSKLYGPTKPRRMSLPTYPFAKDRYWIDSVTSESSASPATAPGVLHPLLHVNTSDLREHRYSSTFSGKEFFVDQAQRVVPNAVLLEMARAGIEEARPERPEASILELREITWGQPFAIQEGRQIHLALLATEGEGLAFEIFSGDDNEEAIHCQGRVSFSTSPAPTRLDPASRDLTKLPMPPAERPQDTRLVLHPDLLDSALQAALRVITDGTVPNPSLPQPVSLELLRLIWPLPKDAMAWIRRSDDQVIDIDLCDEAGNVCVQIRGLRFPATASHAVTLPSIADLTPPDIDLRPVERAKPKRIVLTAPTEVGTEATTLQTRAPIALASSAESFSAVTVEDLGGGIFLIRIEEGALTRELTAELIRALSRVERSDEAKVLILTGGLSAFLRGGRKQVNDAVEQKLYSTLAAFPYPVIAAIQGDALGAGFLVSALCDFMVCAEEARVSFTELREGLFPTITENELFVERLGVTRAHDFLYIETALTGQRLREKGWPCPIVPRAEVDSYTRSLAARLATKPREALRLLKQHLARRLTAITAQLSPIAEIAGPITSVARDTSVARVHIDDGTARFEEVLSEPDHAVVVLEFPEEAEMTQERSVELQRFVLDSRMPVIAVLHGNVRGIAWFVSQFCDACIYNSEASYSFDGALAGWRRTHEAALLFSSRWGETFAEEIVLTGNEYTGAELQRRAGAVAVVEPGRVLAAGLELAEGWAGASRDALLAWKRHNSADIQQRLNARNDGVSVTTDVGIRDSATGAGLYDLPLAPVADAATPVAHAVTPVALRSDVITASAHSNGILVVRMQDRQAKNQFSEAFMAGMREIFAHIQATPAYKAVVITGYDSYFASGGTQESLLAIQRGEVKFTDFDIFHLPVECTVPVIAAMQGHGIGAGWSFGMFADFVVLSEESRYLSPYMDYGFTPGAGATLIFPRRIGYDLAKESLFVAQQYSGAELKGRQLPLPVLPRSEVLPAAMRLAESIARLPRELIVSVKEQLTEHLRASVQETYERELAMHEQTFVGRSDTLEQIRNQFPDVMADRVQTASPAGSSSSVDETGDTPASVTATLRALLAQELHVQGSDMDDDTQFADLGMDSIIAVTWIRKINERYAISLEATKVYAHSTLTALGRYVWNQARTTGKLPKSPAVDTTETRRTHGGSLTLVARAPLEFPESHIKLTSLRRAQTRITAASAPHSGQPITASAVRFSQPLTASAPRPSQPIAIIGMAGQFPQASNVEEFWRNIAAGRDCISEVPPSRWDHEACYEPGAAVSGKTNSRWMGALQDYDLFDPLFFNISPHEAASMDPQQRLFLQACWHGIEHAGYDARLLSGSRCGVFVGCAEGDYLHLAPDLRTTAQGFTGSANSILAGRVAYFLNLQGPCLSIDTACSSSLVALAYACDSLTAGDSDLALAGGVAVMASPEMHIKTAQAGMLSPDGRCFTFDQRANGFVPGEAVGVVVLRRLADAQRDGDIIHGVIEGWGVNQDGKTNGITAPNPESQTRLQQYVYDKYGIDPADIQLIEAHGTGTKLGDPIEVEGLKDSFAKYTQKVEYCALGSVKSNIGHCLAAAGIAGFIKTVLAIEHRQLPPTLHFERLNEHISLEGSPFYVNDRLQDWEVEAGQPRRAAISSFGFSGTNVHLVAAEYAQPATPATQATPATPTTQATRATTPATLVTPATRAISPTVIVPLSARTSEQLIQKARDLLEYIHRAGSSVDLLDLAYTLQVGREAMEERVGVLASTLGQLTERLRAYVEGTQPTEGVRIGQVQRSKERISLLSEDAETREILLEKWIAGGKLAKLLDLWVSGLDMDWNRLYPDVKPRRIVLPLYPFARERCWIDPMRPQPSAASTSAGERLHPLLHTNTSDFNAQSYRSLFTGQEFFLADHRVRMQGRTSRRVLPGVAYLEMARAAVEHAMGTQSEPAFLVLRDTVWLKPLVISEPTTVSIALFEDDGDGTDNATIAYEIFSDAEQQRTVYCEGEAQFARHGSGADRSSQPLDLALLRGRMTHGRLDAANLYALFERIGLEYGPAHRGVDLIERGENELLATLRLPSALATTVDQYQLHPSLMDSALQASIGLVDRPESLPRKPIVPFALESLSLVRPSAPAMLAWVRRSSKSQSDKTLLHVDIDLCDLDGNICVQLRGLSARVAGVGDDTPSFDSAHYQRILDSILEREISVDDAVKLG